MKKTLSLVMVSLMVLLTFSTFAPQTMSEPDETPLEVAEKAAVYVVSQAIPECGGYKWLYYDPTGEYDRPAHMARIGTFLVALYNKTGNLTYLDYAKGLAQWFICKAIPDSGGYKWKHADQDRSDWYLTPTNHDVGEFLLRMYQVTGNTTYLDYAKGAAQWMVAMAEPEAGGWFVPYNPPGKYGSQTAAGIMPSREAHTVTFLLHMYQETGNTDYLDIVKGTAEWLISGPDIVAENGGYKWAHDRPYYVRPEFKFHMPGNSLIALFFYEAYQELGNATYLEYANGAVQWMLSQAVSDDDDYKWPLNQGGTTYYLLPLMEGYAWDNVNDVLLVAYSITSNATYLEYAEKHANWVIRQAVSEGGGYKFPWYEGAGSYYYHAFINALVYRFLSEIYNVVGNASYLDYANGAFAWIVNNATAGSYKWKTINYYPYYPWWFIRGASGIGYHLISAPPLAPPEVSLSATIDVNPDTLNLKSEGKWITCYIELPEGYNISDIDRTTILLNDTFPVDPFWVDKPLESVIGDYDEDDIPDLMVKFNRTALTSHIYHVLGITYGNVMLRISGNLTDGTPFEGSDTIKVIFVGDVNDDGVIDSTDLGTFGVAWSSNPYNPDCDFNRDGAIDSTDYGLLATNYGSTVP